MKVEYFYDYHLTREDRLTGWEYPNIDVYSLLDQLSYLLTDPPGYVAHQLNIYVTTDPTEEPLSPELAVFKNWQLSREERLNFRSWHPALNYPAPDVVFEFTDEPAWQVEETLLHKPDRYRKLGVKEMFIFDGLKRWQPPQPNQLRGWRLDGNGIVEITPDERGWLWSEELDSWVSRYMALREPDGKLRLSEFQALELARGHYYIDIGYEVDLEEWEEYRARE